MGIKLGFEGKTPDCTVIVQILFSLKKLQFRLFFKEKQDFLPQKARTPGPFQGQGCVEG